MLLYWQETFRRFRRISNLFCVVTHFWTQLCPDPDLNLVWTERNSQEEALIKHWVRKPREREIEKQRKRVDYGGTGRGEVNDWQWVSMGHTGGFRNVSQSQGQVTQPLLIKGLYNQITKRVNLAWVGFHIPALGCNSKTAFFITPLPLSYSVDFNLAITFQCFHLIQTLKMPLFSFLAQFVGTICSANMQRWMKPQATNGGMRQIRMGAGGHPIRKGWWPQNWHIWGNHHPHGAQTTHVWNSTAFSCPHWL